MPLFTVRSFGSGAERGDFARRCPVRCGDGGFDRGRMQNRWQNRWLQRPVAG